VQKYNFLVCYLIKISDICSEFDNGVRHSQIRISHNRGRIKPRAASEGAGHGPAAGQYA